MIKFNKVRKYVNFSLSYARILFHLLALSRKICLHSLESSLEIRLAALKFLDISRSDKVVFRRNSSWNYPRSFYLEVLRFHFDEIGAVRTVLTGHLRDRNSHNICIFRWTWEEDRPREFDEFKINENHNHMGSDVGPSLLNRFQNKL